MTENTLFEQLIDDIIRQNYAVVKGLFDFNTLEGLLANFQLNINEEELQRASIGNWVHETVNKNVRSDKILWIDKKPSNQHEILFNTRVSQLSDYLNYTCFTGIKDWEFHYAKYEVGAFYLRHLDQFKNDDSRKFSLITYLNKNWGEKDGGELVMYIDQKVQKILPEFGVSVLFKSDFIEHEVLPAKKERLSITGWLK